jgi:hypothetical protein
MFLSTRNDKGFNRMRDTQELVTQDAQLSGSGEPLLRDVTAGLLQSLSVRPREVILTGSFARGEGSILVAGGRRRVLGDMEFLVVFARGADRARLQAELNDCALRLSADLARSGSDCELEFRAVTREYFSTIRPQVFGYELMAHGRPVAGPGDALRAIPRFTAGDIPRWDAWRLLHNRIIEQLALSEPPQDGEYEEAVGLLYRLVKFQLDLGTAALLFSGRYAASYAARAGSLAQWAGDPGAAPGFLPELARRIGDATRFKLSPNAADALGFRAGTASAEEILRYVAEERERVRSLARQVWAWAAQRLTGEELPPEAPWEQADRAVFATQAWRDKLRGWAKLALMPAVRRQPGFAGRMRRLAPVASPRYLVYSTAARLYFNPPEALPDAAAAQPWDAVERMLPVLFAETLAEERPWFRIQANVLRSWKMFLRNHWA